ncbi:MAG: phosphoribosylformylglycinamidine synthase subunit PurL [Thermoplasmata archaeon]
MKTKKHGNLDNCFEVELPETPEGLKEVSDALKLGLSAEEMLHVKNYFKKLGRNPTDVELNAIGQAWSEHCCYKSSKVVLKKYIFPLEHKDMLLKGDAGVMSFDEEYAYAIRIESHNHPSAVEPYGGAATGIGGILRDVLAMGAQPIALIDPLFFGPLDIPYEKLPSGVKHPKYLFTGVVAGIRDYGNRVGIPTVAGFVHFDPKYTSNCLVNVGCVGIGKKKFIKKNAVSNPGDNFVLVGGLTGRDGIHGVNFASAVLTEKSDVEARPSVQLGNPIMKEPLIHAVMECVEANLVEGVKDLGGGGLSCVCGEMAIAGGCGAEIHLDRVPLKEENMAPWEIWISESQERMMLAVKDENLSKVKEIFDLYDVPCTPIGKAVPEKKVKLYFKGTKVFELDIDFYTGGPEYVRPFVIRKREKTKEKNLPPSPKPEELEKIFLTILSDLNVCSKEWVIRLYDHEVRGRTIIKPLTGRPSHQTHADAVVLKPLEDSYRGLAIAVGSAPWVSALDPYIGGVISVDEVARNLASVGAIPHAMTNCMNFGNPEVPEVLGDFYEVLRGIGDACRAFKIAVPSGNVSFYNESPAGRILPTPVVLGTGIVKDVRISASTDLASSDGYIYLIGETQENLGGSVYSRIYGIEDNPPTCNLGNAFKYVSAVVSGIERGIIRSCHDIGDGGLAVAIAEMSIGGNVGVDINLDAVNMREDVFLFSESPTRWIAEVDEENHEEFERAFAGLNIMRIGRVGGKNIDFFKAGKKVLGVEIQTAKRVWSETLWKIMG